MNLDTLKDKLGGAWYDTWWIAISERFDPMPECLRCWEPDFFEYINEGWLDMYYEPPTEAEMKASFYASITVNSNPYYNEKYYDYEV
jgi:hypothetical protein